MTAINPARLKIQCAELGDQIPDPERFISRLHDLLNFYGARTRQTSLSRTPLSLQAYQVPPPVLRALVLELKERFASLPAERLALLDALWGQDWLEFQQLAALLLGKLPVDDPEPILARIQSWLGSSSAEAIRELIMGSGLEGLSAEKPGLVIDLIRKLIASGSRSDRQAAIYGMASLTEKAGFQNLPLIFNLLQDILAVEETGLVKEITGLIRSLQRQSDQETAYFLVRQLGTANRPRIFRIVRGVLGRFSPESQQLLRETLHTYS